MRQTDTRLKLIQYYLACIVFVAVYHFNFVPCFCPFHIHAHHFIIMSYIFFCLAGQCPISIATLAQTTHTVDDSTRVQYTSH